MIRRLDQPRTAPGDPQGTLQPGADADVTLIDPENALDHRPHQVPLQEPQHPVRRLGSAWPDTVIVGGEVRYTFSAGSCSKAREGRLLTAPSQGRRGAPGRGQARPWLLRRSLSPGWS